MAEPETVGTTAAPNSTTGRSEVAVVPESSAEKGSSIPAETPTAAGPGVATPAPNPEKVDEKKVAVSPIQELWALAKANGHPEIWGVQLADPDSHIPAQIVLQKYLNANDGDLPKAKDQLTKTLNWRKETKPLELLQKRFNNGKFGGLGFVTVYGAEEAGNPESQEVFTWNIYGGVKKIDETFGDLKEFLEWRVALMEQALQALNISVATKPITATYDPYKIVQVHDYKSISFFRQSPSVKAASTETIKVFAQNYPELLKEKFFVNVPAIMGFIYAFMKLFVAAKTVKKFHPMSNGTTLANEFGDSKVKGLGEMLPKEYGGKGSDLTAVGKEPLLE